MFCAQRDRNNVLAGSNDWGLLVNHTEDICGKGIWHCTKGMRSWLVNSRTGFFPLHWDCARDEACTAPASLFTDPHKSIRSLGGFSGPYVDWVSLKLTLYLNTEFWSCCIHLSNSRLRLCTISLCVCGAEGGTQAFMCARQALYLWILTLLPLSWFLFGIFTKIRLWKRNV